MAQVGPSDSARRDVAPVYRNLRPRVEADILGHAAMDLREFRRLLGGNRKRIFITPGSGIWEAPVGKLGHPLQEHLR